MLRRFICVSAIALSSLALANTAKADTTVDIPFNGTVVFDCSFGPVIPGTLVPIGTPATGLSSTAPGGASGMTDILCNGDAEIDITTITKTAGAPFTEVSLDAVVNGSPELPVQAGVPTMLNVDLEVEAADLIPPDDYEYVVTLTAIPD